MASQDDSAFHVSWPGILALLVAVLGLILARPSLESPRPTADVTGDRPARLRESAVPARLWQDPVTTVLGAPPSRTAVAHLREEVPPFSDPRVPQRVLFLLDCIDAETTPESAEVRRRERFATLSALSTAGYAPVDPDRIHYAAWQAGAGPDGRPVGADGKGDAAGHPPEDTYPLPYEWATPTPDALKDERHRPQYRAVCVVWATNARQRLRSLRALKKALTRDRDEPPSFHFAITGRIDSGQLDAVLSEARTSKDDSLRDVRLYVTDSTAPFVRNRLPPVESGPTPEYLIETDDRLATCLADELRRRGISPGKDPIAVIAEWDTPYGRSMHDYFKAATSPPDGHAAAPPADPCAREHSHHVHHYSYLRGLDGRVLRKAPDPDAKGTPAGDDGESVGGPTPGAQTSPTAKEGEGEQQFDYLRRLADQMKLDHEHFKAIGIVGSDVYDKLLLLQALRPRFPEALFFTTDLDARLLQPGNYTDTRNLLIAAPYGLSLNDELQGKVAPFRSSYDTASYLGTLRAVQYPPVADAGCYVQVRARGQDADEPHSNGDRVVPKDRPRMPVHLFQVGRSGAYELSLYDDHDDPVGPKNSRLAPWVTRAGAAWKLLAVLLVAGLLLYPVSRRLQEFLWSPGVNWLWVVAAAALVGAAALGCLIYLAHTTPDQEPFELYEGLSIWPTVILRVLTVGLCVYYIAKAWHDLRKRDEGVREEFSFRPAAAPVSAFAAWTWRPATDVGVVKLYEQFEQHGEPRRRAWRTGLLAAANLMLFAALWLLFDPVVVQARGGIARWSYGVVVVLTLLALAALLMFVVDCTLLAYRFVSHLARQGERYRQWPDELLVGKAKTWGLALPPGDQDPDGVAGRRAVGQWLLVRLIDDVTNVVARLIYCPFVVLLVLVVAHNRLFNDWHWNAPFVLMAGFNASVAIVCGLLLQNAAKRARDGALRVLDELARQRPAGSADAYREKLNEIRAEIDGVRGGAFAGFAQNPVIGAALLPLFGGGGLAALEALLAYLH